MLRINCQHNANGYWCKNKNISRSFLGIGPRCCLIAEGKCCSLQNKYPMPPAPSASKPVGSLSIVGFPVAGIPTARNCATCTFLKKECGLCAMHREYLASIAPSNEDEIP